MRIEGIYDVYLFVVHEISLMPVTLMRIQINDHDSSDTMMLPCHVHDKSDIWIYTESSSMSLAGMMITTGQIDSPPLSKGHT